MSKIISAITDRISEYKTREALMRRSVTLDPSNEDKKLILENFRKDGRAELTSVLRDKDVQAKTHGERDALRVERQQAIKLTKQDARATSKTEE
jgi:bisphosphoglycerate-independent phosphoglycerate mutase (AlkP superfamily)